MLKGIPTIDFGTPDVLRELKIRKAKLTPEQVAFVGKFDDGHGYVLQRVVDSMSGRVPKSVRMYAEAIDCLCDIQDIIAAQEYAYNNRPVQCFLY